MIKRIIVHGRVQGVFYRQGCKEEADRLGVSGSVRNLPDGTVEVVASGTEHQLGELISWCRHGPGSARVDELDVSDVTGSQLHKLVAEGNRLTFVIR